MDTRCSRNDLPSEWTIGTNGKREPKESVLSVCLHDDDHDDEILVYLLLNKKMIK